MPTPDDPMDALDERVRALLRDDGPEAALEHLRAAAGDPDLGPDATRRLAWLHERLGEGARALEVLRDGRRRWPEEVELALEEADLLVRDEEEEAARHIVEEVVVSHPAHGRALAALAALVVEEDPDQGLDLAGRALDADPRLVRAHAVRIDAARLEGDDAEVSRRVDAAIRAVPDEPALRLLRAGLRMERGESEDALRDLQVVWSLSPGHPGTRELALEVVRRRQPLYRALLAYRRFTRTMGPLAVVALLALYLVLDLLAARLPHDEGSWPGALAVLVVVVVASVTWVADALADFAVDLDPAGSVLVDAPRRLRARVVTALVMVALVFGPAGAASGNEPLLAWGLLASVASVPAYLTLSTRGALHRAGLMLLALVGASGAGSLLHYARGDEAAAAGIALLASLTCALSTWVLVAATRLLARRGASR